MLLAAIMVMTPVSGVIFFGLVVLVLIVFAGDVGPIVCSYWLPSVSVLIPLIITSISWAFSELVLLSAGSAFSCVCVLSLGGAQLLVDIRPFLSCSLVSCVMFSLRLSSVDC